MPWFVCGRVPGKQTWQKKDYLAKCPQNNKFVAKNPQNIYSPLARWWSVSVSGGQ